MASPPSPRIDTPPAGADQPAWAKVGIIAVVGFALGIVWPKVAGLELGPAPPGEGKAAASAHAARAEPGPSALAARPAEAEPASVSVGEASVTKCRNHKGDARACDKVAFDEVLSAPLRQLASCPAARGHEGKLSVGFEVDFARARLHVQRGKSSTLPAEAAEGVMKCLEANLASISLAKLRHEHAKYTVFYALTFAPPPKPAASAPAAAPPPAAPLPAASAAAAEARAPEAMSVRPNETSAEVRRGPYVVRDTASRSGEAVGRVAVGDKLTVVERKGDWYRVRFGPGDKEGWLFREALGRLSPVRAGPGRAGPGRARPGRAGGRGGGGGGGKA
ncbi:MAG TPA: SH3 domain-containing protein [Polyangiaceae bacterium]|nr:SH3 domain-containing protein [Polyangiaceae bacterium]